MLSIIIPIGDLSRDEENLTKMLTDVENFQNLEIILVFDFEAYSGRVREFECRMVNCGIKVVKTMARNPNLARMTGLHASSHQHIVFCDSDDIFNLSELDEIACALKKVDALLFFPFDRIDFDASENQMSHMRASYCNLIDLPGLWRTIIPREALKDDFFVPTRMGEDLALLCGALLSSKNVILEERKFYKYVQRTENNLSSAKNQEVYLKTLYGFTELMKENVKRVNFNAILASGIYLSFLLSALKATKLKNRIRVFWKISCLISRNMKLQLCIGIMMPLLIIIKFPKIRFMK